MGPELERLQPVAFLCHPYHRGGVTRWMIDAAVEWSRRGAEAWFVTVSPRRPFSGGIGRPTIQSLLARAVEASGGSGPVCITPAADWRFEFGTSEYRACSYAEALAVVDSGVPVIVSDAADVWRASAMLADRNPLIGVLHSDEDHYYALARRYHESAAALVSVSAKIGASLDVALPSLGELRATIPCGVPLGRFAAAPIPRPPRCPVRISWIGRVEERQKRVTDLPRIAREIIARGLPVEMRIAGDGPDQPLLERAIADQKVGHVTQLLGWQNSDAVASLLKESDVLVLPSNFEGTPVVAMEALASGCAVVASRSSGLAHHALAAGRRCVFLYDVGDVDAAADAVYQAASVAPEERAQAALDLARAEFSIERCVDRYHAVCEAVSHITATRARFAPGWRSWPLVSNSAALVRSARANR